MGKADKYLLGAALAAGAVNGVGEMWKAERGPSKEEAEKERTEIVERSVDDSISQQARGIIYKNFGVDLNAWESRPDVGPLDRSILKGLEMNDGWSRARLELEPGDYYSDFGKGTRVQVPKEIDEENFRDYSSQPDGLVDAPLFSMDTLKPDFHEGGRLGWIGKNEQLLYHNSGDLTGQQLEEKGAPSEFIVELNVLLGKNDHTPKPSAMIDAGKERPYDPVYAMEDIQYSVLFSQFDMLDKQGALGDVKDWNRQQIGKDLIEIAEKGLLGLGIDSKRSYRVTDLSSNDGKVLAENPKLYLQAWNLLYYEKHVAEMIGDTETANHAAGFSAQLSELVAQRNGTLLKESIADFDTIIDGYIQNRETADAKRVLEQALKEAMPQLEKGVNDNDTGILVYKLTNALKDLPEEFQGPTAEKLLEVADNIIPKSPELAEQLLFELQEHLKGSLQTKVQERYQTAVAAEVKAEDLAQDASAE